MGKKGGGDGGAAQARADEQARQADIRAGTKAINRIFDGGKVGTDPIDFSAALDRSKTYYNQDGSVFDWSTVAPSSGLPLADPTLGRMFGKNTNLPTKLYQGVSSTSGFDDDFYNGIRDNYLEYATPQLNRQFGDAQKQLTFALARSGNLDSSARAQKEAELKTDYDTQDRAVKDQALSFQNDARNSVESARADLIRTLNATGDAQGAANSALARSVALSAPQAYSPLGRLFADFTAGLGTQAALERASAYSGGAITPRYNTGLFANPGAVKVM